MDLLLPDYNDPIISILLLLGTFFIIATLSYAYSIYKQDKKRKELIDFVEHFSLEEQYDIKHLKYEASLQKPLALLAHSYLRSGEYNKSIELYLYLLKHSYDDAFLLSLAKAYLKAGFLKRAEKIYLEILSKHPREIEALYNLELIYEKLNQFSEAKEIIEILKNLKEEVSDLELHLTIKEIKSTLWDKEEKIKKLKTLFSQNLYPWVVLRELFIIAPLEAWKLYEERYFNMLFDIINNLKELPKQAVKKSINLQKLSTIKGQQVYNCTQKSDNFYLDLLYSASLEGCKEAEFEFIYICTHCKNRYPLAFGRCPNCHKAYQLEIKVEIAKKKKRDYALL